MSWAQALEDIRVGVATDSVPPEWKTAKHLSGEFKMSTTQTFKTIEKLLEVGSVEMKEFRIKYPSGYRSTPHYRLKK